MESFREPAEGNGGSERRRGGMDERGSAGEADARASAEGQGGMASGASQSIRRAKMGQ